MEEIGNSQGVGGGQEKKKSYKAPMEKSWKFQR